MPAIQTMSIDELTLDDSIDPRLTKRSRERIQAYADNVENLPPILVDTQKRILDGVHRYMAHQLVGKTEIKVQFVKADTRQKALIYVAKYNSRHGANLSAKELKKISIELYKEGATDDAIAEAISRSKATVHAYLKEEKEARKEAAMQMVAKLLEKGVSQKEIARQVSERGPGKISQETVSVWKRALAKKARESETTEELEETTPEEENDVTQQVVAEAEADSDSVSETENANEAASADEAEGNIVIESPPYSESETSHDEIQWLLLSLGNKMKRGLWVANNDRNKSFQGNRFSELPKLLSELPVQFGQRTQRIIELIDVLWLERNSIIAAFEIEHTTSIFSGLLRMSDLMALQPNLNINLFIVAPDERRDKVKTEINRPTFGNLKLPKRCRYIAYSRLRQKIEQAEQGGFIPHLGPSILDEIAESVTN